MRAGLVKSLSRPEGNITGFANLAADISAKLLQMLLSIVPNLKRVAVLLNPTNPGHSAILKNIQSTAQTAGVAVTPTQAQNLREIDAAFVLMAQKACGAVIVALDGIFFQQRQQIADLAAKNRIASIATFAEYVQDGGLISYGQNLSEHYRRGAIYVDKILKGATPGSLPVEQSIKLELVINRKTARMLGLALPESLMISADKVIE